MHFGSTIPSHAFALLSDGGSFNRRNVTGIGPVKAGAVWYWALTVYLRDMPFADFQAAFFAFKTRTAMGQVICATPSRQ